jgi:23S rRNA pseudouridine2605 synthase
MEERLQKIIANAGICSRRKAEDLISAGKVVLNSKVASLGDKGELGIDTIEVNGEILGGSVEKFYYMLHKPKGILVTRDDPEGRETIFDLSEVVRLEKEIGCSLNYVGRLDGLSEGLLLLTNDGDFLHEVTHPSKKISKEYLVRINPGFRESDVARLAKGIMIDERAAIAQVTHIEGKVIRLSISEGRNRIVRNIMEKMGYDVYMLRRIGVGKLQLGELGVGKVVKVEKSDVL